MCGEPTALPNLCQGFFENIFEKVYGSMLLGYPNQDKRLARVQAQ
jgi:hypothetical protein